MDLNNHSLAHAKQQLANLIIETVQADIFQSDPTMQEKFDSISINYLLHCLPGSMPEKSLALKHAASMLKKNGVLFGATILSDEKMQTTMSRKLMSFYNRKSIFSNQSDNLANLTKALERNLNNISITCYAVLQFLQGKKKFDVNGGL